MAITLTGDITADDRDFHVSGGTFPVGTRVAIDDEMALIVAYGQGAHPHGRRSVDDPGRWIVERGQGKTEPTSHSTGAAVIEVVPTFGSDAIPDGGTGGADFSADTGSATAPSAVAVLGAGGASTDVTQAGGPGTAATVTVTAPGGGGSSVRAYTVTLADVLAAPGAIKATYSAGDPAITLTAAEAGIAGNLIAILSDVQPSVGALTIDVSGTTITLHLETDGDSNVLSTYVDVQAAIDGDPEASALLDSPAFGVDHAYDIGDVYLADGSSDLVLDTLADGSVLVGAWVFVPETWDATTMLIPRIGVGGAVLFYDGPPDISTADDEGAGGVAVSQSTPPFNPLFPMRLTAEGDLVVRAFCESGANPSQGVMLLFVDARTLVTP